MVELPRHLSQPEFQELVRDALLHLYDVAYLQTHPLAALVDPGPGDSAVLRGKLLGQTLLETIESLRPIAGTSSDSRAWRSYRLLELRYCEGLGVGEVPVRLDISKTQYQRDHARALEAVASLLWDRWRPAGQPDRLDGQGAGSRQPLAPTEAEELFSQTNPEFVDLAGALNSLLTALEIMCDENHTNLSVRAQPGLPLVYADRVALRQILLGLLSVAVEQGSEGSLQVSLDASDRAVEAIVLAYPGRDGAGAMPPRTDSDPDLEVAARLAESTQGELRIKWRDESGRWQARLTLPIARRPLVLVLDNHPDFIGLVARYLAESGWEVAGAQDVPQAQALALELRPTVVLLDVMIPGQDGWDLLLGLKSRPETRSIPVIVCSVLYEPRVARALGAAGYLRKPINQASLLEALAPWRGGTRG